MAEMPEPMEESSDSSSSSNYSSSEDESPGPSGQKRPKFEWTSDNKMALLHGMINLKPAGLHKHLNMLLIREKVSKSLKKDVPTAAVWEYVKSYWDTDIADKIEKDTVTINKSNFELPKTDEFKKLLEDQEKLLNEKKDKKDESEEAEISNVDLKLLKSVKVMVEKLDSRSLLINCLKLNNILNWEKTLKSGPNSFQTEGTSSNLNINVKNKLSNNVNLKSDDLEEYIVKDQSTNVLKRSIDSDKYLRSKKKRLICLSDTCNLKNPILARSTIAHHIH